MVDVGFDPDDLISNRRSRGLLALDVDMICRQYISGDIKLEEGRFLTPYFIGKILKEQDNLDKAPSQGALSDVLRRWQDSGYAICRREPFAFVKYTELGQSLGYEKYHKNLKKGID